jgi:hypothetical protein
MKFDDRVVWTDRAGVAWTGRYRGQWNGLAELLLEAVQQHGKRPTALHIKVNPQHVQPAAEVGP